MTKQQAHQRIKKLRELINYHRYLYHVLDKEEISDSALDSLKKELFDLEQQHPDLIVPDSPTQRIGGKPLKKFGKVKHQESMLSFNDAFSQEDMRDWEARVKRFLGTKEGQVRASGLNYFCELKFDGLAIELIYQDGVLAQGSTRGDGVIGEDVTQNLKTIDAIPLRLRLGADPGLPLKKTVVVRGEALISKREFAKANKEQEKKGLPRYANPRNIAAGSVRQLDPKITASRGLDFYGYDLVVGPNQETHQQEHRILKTLGFKTHQAVKLCEGLEEVFAFHKLWQEKRESLAFEIDGLVVQVNNNRIFKKLGVVGKAPRGAIAFKFALKQAQTVVEDIKVQIGRTGALTPVAHLRPVEIGGVTVSRATLHNQDEIKRLDIKIGDTVIVGRAGDVIPDVVKVLKDLRTGKEKEFKMPKQCPICSVPLERPASEAIYRCPNPHCRARQRRYLYHFASRSAFDIEGLGPKIIDQLLNQGLINDAADLFALKQGDLLPVERFAEKSSKNIVEAIQTKKKITLARFIYALGVRGVGEETALDLADQFRTLDNLKKAHEQQLLQVKDIGPETAKSIYGFFRQKRNLDFLERLLKAGVAIKSEKLRGKSEKLAGKTLVLTGTLTSLTRDQAKEKIRALAGDIAESVSKNTDFVVLGENPGSKLDMARKLGVKIVREKEFLEMLG